MANLPQSFLVLDLVTKLKKNRINLNPVIIMADFKVNKFPGVSMQSSLIKIGSS